MADTLAQIRSRVSFKVGGKSGIDATLNENINEAILQVIQEAKPQEMWNDSTFTTSSGTSNYQFASMSTAKTDILWVLFVRNTTDDYPLYHRSYEVWNRYKQDTSSTSNLGDPHLWTRWKNGIIVFGRIPDSTSRTLHYDYLKRPTRLSADSDTFPLNDEWKRPVEELAAALTFQDLNAMDKARAKFEEYNSLMVRRMTPEGEEDASPDGSAFIPTSNLNLSN